MWLVDGEDILELWRRVEAFASEAEASAGDDDPDDAASASPSPSDDAGGLHPPYWAVPWVGGQGVARYILDNPEVVRGKRVLDVGSGCGVAALAAARAGAVSVTANDVDPLAAVAFRVNADACGLAGGEESASASASRDACVLETSVEDLLKSPPESVRGRFDVVMAGDVCFQKGLADAFRGWLARVAADAETEGSGVVTLLGDPRRQSRWAPSAGWARGVREAAAYEATTGETHALTEGEATRRTVVWRAG
jgi:predicted nicotinamide N-methyase